jgi:hypothetical protein
MQIDGGIKRLHRFLVVGLCVELEHLDNQLWHILHIEFEGDSLLNLEDLFVRIFELEDDLVLNPLVLVSTEVIGQIDEPLVCQVNLDLLLYSLDVVLIEVIRVFLKRPVLLGADMLKVLRNHIVFRNAAAIIHP